MKKNDSSHVTIIAEAGVNHNGSLETARELARVARDAGADIVKYQTFDPKALVVADGGTAEYQRAGGYQNQLDMLSQLTLTGDEQKQLKEYCDSIGVSFLSTAFDIGSAQLLFELGQKIWKIPSGEITNVPLIEKTATFAEEVILSTGMSTLGEIEQALGWIESAGCSLDCVTVLHCNTEYPTPYADVNLRAMETLGRAFGVHIGYSDHTMGIEVPIAAVALGATVIEKHFTLDRSLPGPDHTSLFGAPRTSRYGERYSQHRIGVGRVEKGPISIGTEEPNDGTKGNLRQAAHRTGGTILSGEHHHEETRARSLGVNVASCSRATGDKGLSTGSTDRTVARVAVFTGTRAEYGLLHPLIDHVSADSENELQLIVSGTHLSPEFGTTVSEIRDAGYPIADTVEMLLSSDSAIGSIKSLGLGMIGFADSLKRLRPDWLIVLGDRFEVLGAAVTGMMLGIPIAHLHGGERTEGAIDESIRHSVTKMAHLHFCSTPGARKRVIQLGEHPDTVFHVGAIGLDRIDTDSFLSKAELAEELGVPAENPWCVVTFHPATLVPKDTEHEVRALTQAMMSFSDVHFIITKANADENGRLVNKVLAEFCDSSPHASLFDSLGSRRYLSCVAAAALVLGNSSSGIIEAPHVKTPTVNIGMRQTGRERGSSVVQAKPEKHSIIDAIELCLRKSGSLDYSDSPYYNGGAVVRIMNTLKSFTPKRMKVFYDVDFSV